MIKEIHVIFRLGWDACNNLSIFYLLSTHIRNPTVINYNKGCFERCKTLLPGVLALRVDWAKGMVESWRCGWCWEGCCVLLQPGSWRWPGSQDATSLVLYPGLVFQGRLRNPQPKISAPLPVSSASVFYIQRVFVCFPRILFLKWAEPGEGGHILSFHEQMC